MAAALLLVVCALILVDATSVQWQSDGPVAMLTAAGCGLLAGAICPTALAATSCLLGAALLTVANQAENSGSDTWTNDLTFFLVMLGGPALLGALLGIRTRQLNRLHRLSVTRSAQHASEVRATRLEEQNRIASGVQHGVIQAMGAIVVQARGADRTESVSEVRDALSAIEASARHALDDLRAHVGLLREPPGESQAPTEADGQRAATMPPARIRLGRLDLLAAASAVPVAVESVLGGSSRGPAWANVTIALLLGVPVLLRRQQPIATAGAFAAIATAASATLTPMGAMVTSSIPLLLVSYAVGSHLRRWRSRLAGVAVLWLGVILVGSVAPAESQDSDGQLPILVWITLAVLGGIAAADRSGRVGRLNSLLAEIELGRAADLRLVAAQQRHAVARDLHDSVAASMTVVCLHAAAARNGLSSGARAAHTALSTIAETAQSGLRELRASLDVLDEAAPDPLPDLDTVVEDARAAGMLVRMSAASDVGDLPVATRSTVARVVREALVNAARHAQGAAVDVRIGCRDGRVEVEVVDTGSVAAGSRHRRQVTGTGHGLSGLAERVEHHGGRLEFGPVAPRGFRVTAVLPAAVQVPA